MNFRWLSIALILLALISCAKPPLHERETTAQLIAQARAREAESYAPPEDQAADAALRDGQRLMDRGEYGEARDAFNLAMEHARRAVVVTQEGRAKEAADERAKRQAAEEARQAAERERIKAEEKARLAAAKAAEAKRRPAPPKPAAPLEPGPEPVKQVQDYMVGEGETLWTIAAQESVYNDALLWPLLYQANRDQIKDPRQIFPGQVLSIRRDLTPQDIEEARQKARASDIFPINGN